MTAELHHPEEGRVLLLPATRRDGEVICAILARESIDCVVCVSAAQVVTGIEAGAATLVLTDIALADAGGGHILEALLRQPTWSDLPVLLLGKADTSPEVQGMINRMTNVTVLERPCSSRTLLSSIRTSLRARERQYQLRDQVAALHAAENALRQTDRRKDEFLAMLAHELRNPLAPIRTASELLPRIIPPGDKRIDSTLTVVKRQVGQLTRLVDDLLDVSRITQGRIELQPEVVDLASIVAQALESVEPLMTAKAHVVLRQAHLPALHVRGDRTRLVQCISNILGNAAKYTDAGGKIQIDLRQHGEFALLSVQDNGIGISAEMLPKVFDLFVQSERALDRSEGGLGIGLSVVKQLVDMHHGSVTARSAGPGQGSIFEIRLPLVTAPVAEVSSAAAGPTASKRVLIVDDNRDAADSISLLLKIHGHDVRTAYGGEDALTLAATYPADVVLLDIGLPGMNGYEVARRLRAAGTSAHLVALTGYGQPEDVKRAREAGFDEHMVKPIDFDRLLETLAADDAPAPQADSYAALRAMSDWEGRHRIL
jgi:two-component system, sensor histidine kinase